MTDKQYGAPPVDAPAPKPKRRRNLLLWILGPALVLGIGGYMYVTSGRYVSTDNAYVQADHVTLAPQVGGRVAEVLVRENQRVKAGDVLFRIDQQPLQIAMTRMQAQMESVRSLLDAARAGYASAQADLRSADEALRVNERQYQRVKEMREKGLVAQRISTTRRTIWRRRAASAIRTWPHWKKPRACSADCRPPTTKNWRVTSSRRRNTNRPSSISSTPPCARR